jgi:DNA-binding Xre family transcriptional regulator
MNNQENTRERLALLILREGTSQKHIARQTRIIESNLSRFKNSTKTLSQSELNKLIQFLELKGY